MQSTSRSRSQERGQILVIVAGGAITLILLMGLVLDGGLAFLNRRDGQNTADLMSLAGAKFIADVHRGKASADPSVTTTYQALSSSAVANDCLADGAVPCIWQAWFVGGSAAGPVDIGPVTAASTVPANALGVRVGINRQPGTFVVGFVVSNWNVDTQATALAERIVVPPAGQLLPIGFMADPTGPFQYGQVHDLTDGKDLPGGFGWLTWSGSTAATVLRDSICTPDNPEFYLPIPIDGSTGTMNSSGVRNCLNHYIDTQQVVLIPMYQSATGHGAGSVYEVIGVAAFVLTAIDQPAVGNIRGYFVEIFSANPVPGGASSAPPTASDQSFSLSLVR